MINDNKNHKGETMNTKIILLIALISSMIIIAGCGGNEPESQMKTSEPTGGGAAKMGDSAVDQGDTSANPLIKDQGIDFGELEVTPSGDSQCFLSPCDCNCYVIPNVPEPKRKPTCGTDCNEDYGIKGCRFTNYQCAKIE